MKSPTSSTFPTHDQSLICKLFLAELLIFRLQNVSKVFHDNCSILIEMWLQIRLGPNELINECCVRM
jgi:hypothetical protein